MFTAQSYSMAKEFKYGVIFGCWTSEKFISESDLSPSLIIYSHLMDRPILNCRITFCFTGNCCCQHNLESWFFWRVTIMASQWLSWVCCIRGLWSSWRRDSKLRTKLCRCFKSHRMLARPGTRYHKQSIPWFCLHSLRYCSCFGCFSGTHWSPSNTETGVPKWSH